MVSATSHFTIFSARVFTVFAVITLSIGTDRPLQTVDPNQMLQNEASNQGQHCLPYKRQYFRQIKR